jgi:hypothetical protein
MSPRRAPDTSKRAGWGFLLGLFVAGAFSVLVAVLWLWNGRSLGHLDVTLKKAVMMYGIWGGSVGTAVGILLPVTRTPSGAAGVGALVMTSGLFAAQMVRGATTVESVMGAVVGLAGGAVAGYKLFPQYWAWSDRGE